MRSSSPVQAAQPLPAPHSAAYTAVNAGAVLPDSRLTPGAVLAGITTGRVCTSGYSASVRDVDTALREAVFAEYGVAYPEPSGSYEVDHLVPLELGGSNSVRNLWPEPAAGLGFHAKDALEDRLHTLVCDGRLPLSTAQRAIATNWYAAYLTYVRSAAVVPPAPAQAPVQVPAPAPPPAAAPTSNVPAGALARCNDGTYSFAAHHQGACSHHHGVAVWYR